MKHTAISKKYTILILLILSFCIYVPLFSKDVAEEKTENSAGIMKMYSVPDLPYAYNALEPYISEKLIRIHHDKLDVAAVNAANAIFQKMDQSRNDNSDFDTKATFKALSYALGSHKLHDIYWYGMAPNGKGGGGLPSGTLASKINDEFGSFDRFKKLFSSTAQSVEGSGWAALAFDPETKRLIIMQIEKHNMNLYPLCNIILILDVYEHAYFMDYMNERNKYIEAWWNIVNWDVANTNLKTAMSKQ